MPRPMIPTQLTVLTIASASAVRISPVLDSIIAIAPLVIPCRPDLDPWPVRDALHGVGHPGRDALGMDADPLDKAPGEGLLDKEFGLLPLLHVRRAEIGRRHRVPIDFVQAIQPRAELRVVGAGIRQRERPAAPIRLGPRDHPLKIGFKMDDRLLAASIGQCGMIRAVNHVKHDGPRTKIERDAVANGQSIVAGDRKTESPLLDAAHPDDGATLALDHDRIRPQASVPDNRGEVIDVDDVVDFRSSRSGHGQAATSSFSGRSTDSSRSSLSGTSWTASIEVVSGRVRAAARTSSLPVTTSEIRRVRNSQTKSISFATPDIARFRYCERSSIPRTTSICSS